MKSLIVYFKLAYILQLDHNELINDLLQVCLYLTICWFGHPCWSSLVILGHPQLHSLSFQFCQIEEGGGPRNWGGWCNQVLAFNSRIPVVLFARIDS